MSVVDLSREFNVNETHIPDELRTPDVIKFLEERAKLFLEIEANRLGGELGPLEIEWWRLDHVRLWHMRATATVI